MTIPYRVGWAVLSKAHPPGTAKCLSVSGHLREIRRKTKADRNDETSNIFTPTTFIDVTATITQPMPTLKTTTSTSSATSSATSQNSTQNSSHSSDHKLAIGLGLGLSIPFLALMVFFCCSRPTARSPSRSELGHPSLPRHTLIRGHVHSHCRRLEVYGILLLRNRRLACFREISRSSYEER
jgi:hypothetical protein